EGRAASLAEVGRNFITVVTNPRFMLFLLIFTGYWVVFWQQYIVLPLYIHGYINPNADVEKILITDGLVVISLQVVFSSFVTRKIPALRAITLGTLVSSLAWLIVAARPAVWAAVFSLVVLALGEITQSPRYYEYVSRLAPAGQQGTYMGFAFLPIGLGSIIAGRLGGFLIHHFGEVRHQPERIWWAVTGVGIFTALLLSVYDRVVKPERGP
ncbi:MAG TPA: hypothetical protein VF860_11990, partial [Candidatus Acidoferrales bacterium]